MHMSTKVHVENGCCLIQSVQNSIKQNELNQSAQNGLNLSYQIDLFLKNDFAFSKLQTIKRTVHCQFCTEKFVWLMSVTEPCQV